MSDEAQRAQDAYVEIAKASIRAYVTNREVHKPVALEGYAPLFGMRAGVFVTIKKTGELRGCIGTIKPVRNNIAEEIVYNAIDACSRDPRFYPVGVDELPDLTVGVDVLSEAEPVGSPSELDVLHYGVIVSRGRRRGLLLPNLEGVDTVEYQLRVALSKAGIDPSEPYEIERFEVVRHEFGGSMR